MSEVNLRQVEPKWKVGSIVKSEDFGIMEVVSIMTQIARTYYHEDVKHIYLLEDVDGNTQEVPEHGILNMDLRAVALSEDDAVMLMFLQSRVRLRKHFKGIKIVD